MATSAPGAKNIRAASILTNGVVNSASQVTNVMFDQQPTLLVDFTLGSLTNVILIPQSTYDGTNWFNLFSPGTLTLTATGKTAVSLACKGCKAVRVSAQGTGTVTASSLTLDLVWVKRAG